MEHTGFSVRERETLTTYELLTRWFGWLQYARSLGYSEWEARKMANKMMDQEYRWW
jgi:hypothetical protein